MKERHSRTRGEERYPSGSVGGGIPHKNFALPGSDFPTHSFTGQQNRIVRGVSMGGQQKEPGFSLVELLIVVVISLIVTAMAVPNFITTLRNYRTNGDARDINSSILLAKMRGAANFTRARVYFDITGRTFRIEVWNKTASPTCAANTWCTEGGAPTLSQEVNFGYGTLGTPPPGTQTTMGQGCASGSTCTLQCKPGAANNPTGGADIADTTCIMFNSRGIPVDNTGAPFGDNAIYIIGGGSVYASTVSATGQSVAWRTDANAASWAKR